MFTQRTPTKPRSPDHLGLPPPLALDLTDTGRRVGWVEGDTIGFRGFGSEVEAAHAARVAHRTIARRLARQHGGRSVLVDTEPLALERRGDTERVLASGLPIATLLRPGPESRSGPDHFGFELRIPGRADELTMRSMSYLAYRTLRESGLRWAMWTGDGRRVARERATHEAEATSAARSVAAPDRAPCGLTPGWIDPGLRLGPGVHRPRRDPRGCLRRSPHDRHPTRDRRDPGADGRGHARVAPRVVGAP
jgi:hypothetical protein